MDFTDTPPEIKGMVYILRKLQFSFRNIEDKLKELGFNISHTTAKRIIDRWESDLTFNNYRKGSCGPKNLYNL